LKVNKALLVLENPWWPPKENPKRASILPFLHGLEKLIETYSIYYSTFYSKDSFREALVDVSNTMEKRCVLYVASHGTKGYIGDKFRLTTFFDTVSDSAKLNDIEGVFIGSCYVGDRVEDLKETIMGTRIAWIFGYKCSLNWLNSTLVDLSILSEVMSMREHNLRTEKMILEAFKKALQKFNGSNEIGEDEITGEEVLLKDSVTLVVRPHGCKKPRDVSDDLCTILGWK